MMLPSYSDIVYFVMVAENSSLSRAAERLGVVQPTLSQAMRRLEGAVGVELILRKKDGVHLTRAGETFLNSCHALLGNWENVLEELHDLDHAPSGHFKLGFTEWVGITALSESVDRIVGQEKLNLNIVRANSSELYVMLLDRKVDIALLHGPARHSDLEMKKLCYEKTGIYGVEKASNAIIFNPEHAPSVELLHQYRQKHEVVKEITSNSPVLMAQLASQGLGLAILPEAMTTLGDGLLPTSGLYKIEEIYLAYRVDQRQTAGLRFVLDVVYESYQKRLG